jgi:hypothetical protein
MIGKSKISSFAKKLNGALAGDLSGWKLAYERSDGLRRHCLKDPSGNVYDAYSYDGSVHVYDPEMRRVGG